MDFLLLTKFQFSLNIFDFWNAIHVKYTLTENVASMDMNDAWNCFIYHGCYDIDKIWYSLPQLHSHMQLHKKNIYYFRLILTMLVFRLYPCIFECLTELTTNKKNSCLLLTREYEIFFDLFMQSGFQIQFSFLLFLCVVVVVVPFDDAQWFLPFENYVVYALNSKAFHDEKKIFFSQTNKYTKYFFFCIFCHLHIVHSQKSTIKMGKQKKKTQLFIYIHFS